MLVEGSGHYFHQLLHLLYRCGTFFFSLVYVALIETELEFYVPIDSCYLKIVEAEPVQLSGSKYIFLKM